MTLTRQPLIAADARLIQDALQEIHANISTMRIGNSHNNVTTDHVGMFAAGNRPVEASRAQAFD